MGFAAPDDDVAAPPPPALVPGLSVPVPPGLFCLPAQVKVPLITLLLPVSGAKWLQTDLMFWVD